MLTRDLAKDNILVSTICIRLIKSGQTERRYTRAKESNPGLTLEGFWGQEAKERNIPLDRVGAAQEAGDVIAFLASERASYLTGIAVNIFGIRALAHLHLRAALLDQVRPAGVGAALLDEACRGADRIGGVGAGAAPGGTKHLYEEAARPIPEPAAGYQRKVPAIMLIP